MSSPDEPGYPRASERSGNANGSPAVPAANGYDGAAGHTAGPAMDSGDVPPWQRAANRAEKQRPDPEQPVEAGSGNSPEARLNRFMSGGSAPPTRAAEPDPTTRVELPSRTESRTDTRSERTELARPEAYASELPDLSGPVPRPPQRRPPGERPSQPEPANRVAAVTSRIQVAHQPRGPVRASMQIRRVDPWTVLKVSLVLSVALFFIWMISVAFLYLVLGGMGVWSKLNSNVGDLLTSASGTTGGELVSSGTIFGGAGLIGLVNIVLLTAMATIGAFIYNLTTDLVGGVEVTLADRD